MVPVNDAEGGSEPLARREVNAGFGTTPFARLARTHFLSVAGDALFVIAMATSVFFSLDFNAARWRVLLFLLLTLVPFAVVGPFLGPAIDRARGGRRLMIMGSALGRAVLCLLIIQHEDQVFFYFEAFLMLVLGKSYHVAKSALVPTTVRNDTELVEANSKLALSSGIAGASAAIPGGLLSLLGPSWVLGFGSIVFLVASGFAFRIAKTPIASAPAGEEERAEVRGLGIRRAAESMGLMRSIVGFLSFLLAFAFKDAGLSMAAVLIGAQGGVLLGAFMAPRLREAWTEERILTGAIGVVCGGALLIAVFLSGTLVSLGAALLSLVVGSSSSAAKQSFDAIVQRDAPDANFGRQFARFESTFQLYWCAGALLPTAIDLPLRLGFVTIGLVAGWSLIRYVTGARRAQVVRERRLAVRAADGGPSEGAPPRLTGFERVRHRLRRRPSAPSTDGVAPPGHPDPLRRTRAAADPSSIGAPDEDPADDLADDLPDETDALLARLEFRPAVPAPGTDVIDLAAPPSDAASFVDSAPSFDRPDEAGSVDPTLSGAVPADRSGTPPLPGFGELDITLVHPDDPTEVLPAGDRPRRRAR